MHLMLASGASKPRKALAFFARNSANSSGVAPATVRSRTFFSGRFSASTLRAKAMAVARSSPSGASSSTSPIASAALPPTGAPLVTISSALAAPTMRGSRCVPPAPASRPSLTSGRPTRAEGTATR